MITCVVSVSCAGYEMSLFLYGDWGCWRPNHFLWMRVSVVGGTYTWFLCPSPSDDSSIGGKASRLEGCEGVCALFGLSVRGCGVSLPLCSRAAY